MANKDYKTIRVANDTYDKLRELKYKKNKSYIDILKACVDKEYMKMKEDETNNKRGN